MTKTMCIILSHDLTDDQVADARNSLNITNSSMLHILPKLEPRGIRVDTKRQDGDKHDTK